MNTGDALRRAMVDEMTKTGYLRTQPWVAAFTAVPRDKFVSWFFRQTPDLTAWDAVTPRDEDWLDEAYTDTTLVTQLDNNPARMSVAVSTGNPVTGVPTSSSTAPGLMALMLEALDIEDDARVLEIGTGTGYNSALLCHRLRSSQVTSVEVDAYVAESARMALLDCGYHPKVITGDGMAGYAGNAPYDRIIATVAAPRVPTAWTDQLRPGGLLLTNLARDLGGGALVRLCRDEPGQMNGRFLPEYGGFMPVRSAPPADTQKRLGAALATNDAATTSRASDVCADALDHPDFGMLAALRLPGAASIGFEPSTGPQTWLLATDGSWASIDLTTNTVIQYGSRRLWDEVENLHQRWTDAGTPTRDRFGLTVDTDGTHRFWLDTPDPPWWTDPYK
jgi:methyltransferase of ATP-grasp peptide maturase system